MAIVKRKTFGSISGKTLYGVYRIMNGKEFISQRPEHYNASQSDKAIEGRKNFAATIAFAKMINSIPELKEIWRNARMPGTLSFNRIIKSNVKLVSEGSLTKNNIITPPGHYFSVASLSIQNNILDLTFSFPGVKEELNIEPPFLLYIFFYMHGHKHKSDEPGNIIFQVERIETSLTGESDTISINLDEEIKQSLYQYKNAVIYLSLSGLLINRKKIYWTRTFSKEI